MQIRGLKDGWVYSFLDGFVLPWGDERVVGGMYELVPYSGCGDSHIGMSAYALRVTNKQFNDLGKRGLLGGRAGEAFCRWNGLKNCPPPSTRVDKPRKAPTETMESLWN